MVLQPIANFPQIPCSALSSFPAAPAQPTAVLTTDRRDEAALMNLAVKHGPKLVVPEVWRELLPQSGILISSALSGGTFRQRMEEAARISPKRCFLLLEPMQQQFSLPCSDGQGHQTTIMNYDHTFFSDALCCQYAHFSRHSQGIMVLWDTEESLQRKLELARQAGFLGYAWSAVTK